MKIFKYFLVIIFLISLIYITESISQSFGPESTAISKEEELTKKIEKIYRQRVSAPRASQMAKDLRKSLEGKNPGERVKKLKEVLESLKDTL
ncbi:MAG: hypothetical protein WCG27_05915 [Pseudomonadota bacterium]